MRVIRRGVFETNSSSSHSITIDNDNTYDELYISDGKVVAGFEEFGWDYDRLYSANEKLEYVITSLQYNDDVKVDGKLDLDKFINSKHFKWLDELIHDETGANLDVKPNSCGFHPFGYVDHQSIGTIDMFMSDDEQEFKEKMKDLIFSNKYSIIIDHDNH